MALDSSTSSSASQSLGSLAALKTMVTSFPFSIDSFINGSGETSIDFLVSIISMIDSSRTAAQRKKAKKKAKSGSANDDAANAAAKNVSRADTLSDIQNIKDAGKAKIAEIFYKIVNQTFLDTIEYAVKGLLFANFKNLFTCDLNPLIPDDLFFEAQINFPIKGNEASIRSKIKKITAEENEFISKKEEYVKEYGEEKYKEKIADYDSELTRLNNELVALKNGYLKGYNGRGIDISVNDCDPFALLNHCPVSDAASGSNLYFDCKDRIYDNIKDSSSSSRRKKGNSSKKEANTKLLTPSLTTQQLWQSQDFNAYLWWIINRRSSSERAYTWDNRVKVMKSLKDDETRNAFFGTDDGKFFKLKEKKLKNQLFETEAERNASKIKDINRFGIVKCKFIEQTSSGSNMIRVWLNPYRYVRGCFRIKSSKYTGAATVFLNKTLFEFNYDYIFGLKLFDSKVLVSQIINAIFGISVSTKFNISTKKDEIEAKLSEVVNKMVTEEDTTIDNCYYTFSNDELDSMLKKSKLKHEGIVQGRLGVNDEIKFDAEDISDKISQLGSATLDEQETIIKNIFNSVEETTPAVSGDTTIGYEFSYANNLLAKLLKETIMQLVLQILTPKVAFLFKLNAALMGNVDYTKTLSDTINGTKTTGDTQEEKTFDSWQDFIENMQELVVKLVFMIKDFILKEVLSYVISLIKPLIEAATIEYAKEAVEYYRKGLQDILDNCTFDALFGLFGSSKSSGNTIDNVNYADITQYATKPNYNTCDKSES